MWPCLPPLFFREAAEESRSVVMSIEEEEEGYAKLVGRIGEDETEEYEEVSFLITKLPVTLGRHSDIIIG